MWQGTPPLSALHEKFVLVNGESEEQGKEGRNVLRCDNGPDNKAFLLLSYHSLRYILFSELISPLPNAIRMFSHKIRSFLILTFYAYPRPK